MSHSFLKESKLFIVYGGNKYRIYTTTAIDFSQTFAEDSYPVKTLHNQTKMFEGTSITKANPADFSFEVPFTKEKKESIMLDLATNLNSENTINKFDAYIQTGASTFKLESALITSLTVDFGHETQFSMSVEGTATKLTRIGDENASIPGTLQSEGTSRTPLLVYPVLAMPLITSSDITGIVSCLFQLANNVNFVDYETLQKSLNVTGPASAMYPSTYKIEARVVSGTIVQYQTDDNITQLPDFTTGTRLLIKAIEVGKAKTATPFWQLEINPAMFTKTVDVADTYTQTYSFRSTDNTALESRITQYS